MNLYIEAMKANRDHGGKPSHMGVRWEVFFKCNYNVFEYIGCLESPDMCNYSLSEEYNPKFEYWFQERIKAYGVYQGYSLENLRNLCFRKKMPFGNPPREDQMTYITVE